MKKLALLFSLAISASLLADGAKAFVEIHPTRGNTVHGRVDFEKVEKGVRVTAHLSGLSPGTHGFHIHEKGDCSSPDASSAGGHFNPTDEPHGAPDDLKRHAGDLGNIEANDKGEASYDRVDTMIALDGPNSIIGRALIIHQDKDDFKTQPTGNAGARIGCGVIQKAP
jgi:Cu-Zn family superoxide dismutase